MFLEFSNYIPVSATITDRTPTSVSFGVVSDKPAHITVFVFKEGIPVSYLTTEDYVSQGTITVQHQLDTQDFSLFIIRTKDGFSNSTLGKSLMGAYFKNIRPENAISSSGTLSELDIKRDSAYVIQVPINSEDFHISYTRIGSSVSEIGEMEI